MKKVFISQPMNMLSKEDILKNRERAIKKIKEEFGEDIIILDSYVIEVPKVKMPAIYCLGKAIEILAEADIVYFMKGWAHSRGCSIEHSVAINYGCFQVLYE